MEILNGVLAVITSYVVGSVHFAWIVTRLVKRADIRQLGNKNPGAANVIREVGKLPGIIVLVLDAAKGAAAVYIARWLETGDYLVMACGLIAIGGHMWSVFFKFRGGGGAATVLGVFFALAPAQFSICFAVMVILVALTRNFGVSVGIGLVIQPFVLWAFGAAASLIIVSIAALLLLGVKQFKGWPALFRRGAKQGWTKAITEHDSGFKAKSNQNKPGE